MVKVGPDARYARFMGKFYIWAGVAFLALLAFYILYQAVIALIFPPWSINFPLYPLLVISPLFITEGIFFIKTAPRLQHIENRRQAVASGRAEMQAVIEQPIPSAASLSLPFTIKLVPSWPKIGVISACIVFLSFAPIAPHMTDSLSLIILSALVPLAILGFIILLALIGQQQIEVTNSGLTVRTGSLKPKHTGKIETIHWEDAQLFIIVPRILNQQDHLSTGYELSGPTTIVRWVRIRRRMRFSIWKFLTKPALPFDEYDRQMDALLSLIAGRTGLPLYDLR